MQSTQPGTYYGVALTFPPEERLAFERDVLYPLAGLDSMLAATDSNVTAIEARGTR